MGSGDTRREIAKEIHKKMMRVDYVEWILYTHVRTLWTHILGPKCLGSEVSGYQPPND